MFLFVLFDRLNFSQKEEEKYVSTINTHVLSYLQRLLLILSTKRQVTSGHHLST